MPPLTPPINGIADGTTFTNTPAGFAPPGSMVNVVPYDPQTGRPQIGKRPGLRKVFSTQLGKEGNRRIQCLRKIARAAAVDTFELGQATSLSSVNALSRVSDLVNYNIAVVEATGKSLREAFLAEWSGAQASVARNGAETPQDLTPETGTPDATPEPSWCDISPDETLAAVGFNYQVGGQHRCLVVFIDPQTGDLVGSKMLMPPDGEDLASTENAAVATNAHCWTSNALWIARGASLWYAYTPRRAGKTRLYDPETTVLSLAGGSPDFPIGRVASRVTGLCTYGGNILACFEGVTGGGTFANPAGVIDSGTKAKHYRSGVFLLVESVSGASVDFAVSANFGGATSVNQPYAETVDASNTVAVTHNSVRFSRVLNRAPRGCLPTGIACAPDGSFAVCFTNQGYGPTTDFLPNGAVAYTTVAKFNAQGTMLWEADTQSVIGGEQGGYVDGVGTQYPCDIPDESLGGNPGTTSKDGPAIRSIVMTTDGLVIAAGRVNAGLVSVFALGISSGGLVWRKGLESNRPQDVAYTPVAAGASERGVPAGGLSLDTGDRSVVAVAARNNTWQSEAFDAANTERPYAVLFRLSPVDGEILWGFDVIQDATTVDPLCCVAGSGVVVFGQSAFEDT